MIRVGLGYDIHRIVEGRPLILAGCSIPAPFGLDGHSDADVILHAVMDALLGAVALGDIGRLFPPDDERYRDSDSLKLLRDVRQRVHHVGWFPVNVDVVVIAEAPRIAPYVQPMRQNLADALLLPQDAVSIKATTNERVGAEGRGEAISAQAVALLETVD